jgi:hypothetical protein
MPRASKATRRKAAPRKARKRTAKRAPLALPVETSDQAITAIAQDAVLILRRGMAYHANRALEYPQTVQMHDCVALLRLVAEIGPAAMRGADGGARADYSRLSPEELAQYATLSLKVESA